MTATKLYLMTTSCSGKSYFVQRQDSHCGLPVVDFSKVNRAAEEGRLPEAALALGDHYRERVIAYLQNVQGDVCVLGRRGPVDPPMSCGIQYAAVLIPVADHQRNWSLRKAKRPHTRWAEFSALEHKRNRLQRYAEDYGMPIFGSFTDAIESLLETS